jgi:hypothetical protein
MFSSPAPTETGNSIGPDALSVASSESPGAPRSRRAILAAAVGGVVASLAGALGRPAPARAAAGDPLIVGQANNSGISQTTLTNSGTGAAFTLKTTNTVSGATGIFGWTSQTGTGVTRGVYAKAEGPNSYGVQAFQAASSGSGAAILAAGTNNDGMRATTDNAEKLAVYGTNSSSADFAIAIRGVITSSTPGQYSAGVVGTNLGTGGNGIGVWGSQNGTGTGVYGAALGGTGVYGLSDSGTAVRAYAISGIGLLATSDSGTAAEIDGRMLLNGMADVVEVAEPASPAANQARLFARDADGKTQICVKFSDGTVTVLAAQP